MTVRAPTRSASAGRPESAVTSARPGRQRGAGGHGYGWLFISPYLILLFAFGVGPAGYALYESFVDELADGGIGVENYIRLLGDFRFWPALMHVGLFLAIWLPTMVFGVLMLALLVHDRPGRFAGTMRLVYFLPGAVTGSAAVLLWYSMLEPSLSPFAPALRSIGLTSGAEVFQESNLTFIFALMAFTTGVGQWVVILYGAFQNIPIELLESAAVDGCGRFKQAFLIKLPLVYKYVLYMIILSFAAGMQIFVEPQLIYAITRTAGSPWWSPNQLGYELAFGQGDLGGAAAISMVLLGLCTIGALVLIARTSFFRTDVDR